jgi:hypothetical protein
MYIATVSFRLILSFWYFCFLLEDKTRLDLFPKRTQKYRDDSIHRKLQFLKKLQRPRGRYFLRRLLKFRPSFPIHEFKIWLVISPIF